MKVNEDKLLQAAVDYVAVLLSENGASVRDKSPDSMLIEKDSASWRVQIERKTTAQLPRPWNREANLVATVQTLRDAVEGVDRGGMMEQIRKVQKYVRYYNRSEWIFEITVDSDSKRLRLGGEPFDDSQNAVGVMKFIHSYLDDAREVAESLVEMCNAVVSGAVWTVALYHKGKTSREWKSVGKHDVYGVSHLLMGMIELLTRSELLPPGHGLRNITKVEGKE